MQRSSTAARLRAYLSAAQQRQSAGFALGHCTVFCDCRDGPTPSGRAPTNVAFFSAASSATAAVPSPSCNGAYCSSSIVLFNVTGGGPRQGAGLHQLRCFASPPQPVDNRHRLAGQPLPETHPHLLAPGELVPGITAAEFAQRRQALGNALGPNAVAILPSASVLFMAGAEWSAIFSYRGT